MALTLSLDLQTLYDYNSGFSQYYANEGETVQVRIVSSDPSLNESVQIAPWSMAGSFVSAAPLVINFTAGGPSTQFASFQLADDTVFELNETFGLSVTPINNAVLNTSWLSGVVTDYRDALPTVSIAARETAIVEGTAGATFRFDVTRQGSDLSMVTDVEVRFEGNGATPATSADFSGFYAPLTPTLIRFQPGEALRTIELPIVNDSAIEGNEELRVAITSATSTKPGQYWASQQYNPIGDDNETVAVLNDDSSGGPAPRTETISAYRFYNTGGGTHFYTTSAVERDSIIANLPSFNYEGVGFQTVPGESSGADAVYRFYNTVTGTHFFTISAAERDTVRATIPSYTYEGVAMHASDRSGAGLTEMYRFYNTDTGTHFYTASLLERDLVRSSIPSYQYDGVAFHVPEAANSPYLLG